MSILIKGIEMPKEGARAFTIVFSDGKAAISVEPFEWHEVIPIPDHGRLIDADNFVKYYKKIYCDNCKCRQESRFSYEVCLNCAINEMIYAVGNYTTIIEAEDTK